MTVSNSTPKQLSLALIPAALLLLLIASWLDPALAQTLFLNLSYYLLLLTVLCWGGKYLQVAHIRGLSPFIQAIRDNAPGLISALIVTVVAGVAIEPALRVLSDEANLVGISKSLFYNKSPTFTLSGKSYYGAYFSVDSVIDQRPPLFPFFVSLLHAALGYSYKNVFYFNLLILWAFVFLSYRFAKRLAGETTGIVTSLAVVAHPVVLISARSGGFDFFTAFVSLLVLASLHDFLRSKGPEKFALLWLNLCLLAGIRYESALFIPPILLPLFYFRLVTWETLRPNALLYALTPAFLLPRTWISLLRGNVPKQAPGTVTFSLENFLNNLHEYFQPILDPTGSYPAHSAALIAFGVIGVGRWLWLRPDRVATATKKPPNHVATRLAILVCLWMLTQAIIVFTYVWGRAQFPSAARLVISLDIFFSFFAAWLLVRTLRRWHPLVAISLVAGLLIAELPHASTNKFMSQLTETRENAALWKYFERVPNDDILIVAKRPNHFTIMNYGAMSFENAKNDPYLFTALDRRLFREIYLIQQIEVSSGEPLPGYEFWSTRELRTVFEFQNEANVLTRVSQVAR